MELLEQLKRFNEAAQYDCSEIAEKLISLTNLENDGQLGEELTEALYHIEAVAQNPYNRDCFRVLYNVLLMIAGMED